MKIRTRKMEERDVEEADRIVRLAFGTFLGVPDPMAVFGDSDYAHTRFHAAPQVAIAAEVDGKFAGSNFVARWGSFGFFGPLTVDPLLWDKGVAQNLLAHTMRVFEELGCRHTGLFTFSHSAKHAALYQKFDYWPQFLTPVMAKAVDFDPKVDGWTVLSELRPGQRQDALTQCMEVTDSIYDGLEVSQEIRAVESQNLGDTVLLVDGSKISAFAVCHVGAQTEAGSDTCYIKFGAVHTGISAPEKFVNLLDACNAYARSRAASKLVAGVNMARHEAYRTMLNRGFRTFLQGVALQKGNVHGFNRPGVYVLDDWR